jgi:DNA-binding CsgD family transcriptional regulator
MNKRRPGFWNLLLEAENYLIQGDGFDHLLENDNLVQCWKRSDCDNKRCPAYGRGAIRCWQVIGTLCNKRLPSGSSREKWSDCSQCPIFKAATPTPTHRLRELLNNIVFALRHGDLAGELKVMTIRSRFSLLAREFHLTPRQADLLPMIIDRLPRRMMARTAGVSEETVKMHLRGLYRKLGVNSREALLAKLGVID